MSYGYASSSRAPSQPSYAQPKAPPRPKVRLRVSYNLQSTDQVHRRHCFGINSLSLNEDDNHLFSAGRDSTVRCWDVNKLPVPDHVSCFEHHTDWVNDIFLCNSNKTLVSCSSDASIKVWDTSTTTCTRTINRHADYVKALAYAPQADVFASAGLDANIYMWDLQQCTVPVASLPSSVNSSPSLNSSSGFRNNVAPTAKAGVDKGSMYSLAINANASIVLSGSTEKLVRAWDPRSGQKLFKLKGHTDNIKALCVNDEGTLCISGSSDFTMRLWDLRQQQCIHVFELHDDSVWSVAADPTFTTVLSGGRDGSVFATDLVASHSTLVCTEQFPVVKILYGKRGNSLWVSTTDSCIKNWGLESSVLLQQRRVYSPPVTLSSSPTTSSLNGPKPAPVISVPRATILGRPGMIKHHILNNRRHVLTKDSLGSVELWDITKGKQIESFGAVNFESKLESLTEVVSVPNWFSVDTKTGSLTVHMDCPQCFSAEVYAGDVLDHLPPEDDELQLNLGESVLKVLFSYWEEGRRALENRQKFDSHNAQRPSPYPPQYLPPLHQTPHPPPPPQTQQLPQQLPPIQDRPQMNGVGVHDTSAEKTQQKEDSTPTTNGTNSTLTNSTSIDKSSLLDKSSLPPLSASTTLTNPNNLAQSTTTLHSSILANPTLSTSSTLNNSSLLANSSSLGNSTTLTNPNSLKQSANGPTNPTSTTNHANDDKSQKEQKLPMLSMPESVSVIISEEGTGATMHRAFRSQFVGDEPTEIIPQWVVDCLLHNEMPPMRANPKIGFYLVTADEKDLPPLPQGNGRLSAHRLLRIRKVANYVVQKLELELPLADGKGENSDEKEAHENGVGASDADDAENDKVPPEQFIDILCNNKVLSPTHSLATVKAFFWKSGDDIVLNYRLNSKYNNSADSDKKNSGSKKNSAKKPSVAKRANPFHRK